MENLVKAVILMLVTLVVLERMTRHRKGDGRSNKTDIPETEVPPVSVHGYVIPEPSTPHHGCDSPAVHGGHNIDSGCGGFSSGHHH
jgi:hypothetical protein